MPEKVYYWVVMKLPGMKGTHKVTSKTTRAAAEDEAEFRRVLDKANKVRYHATYSVERHSSR